MTAGLRRSTKQGPTYYTPERVERARDHLKRHDWAKRAYDRVLTGDEIRYFIGPRYGSASSYAEQSDEFMWMLQPTTAIGRVLPRESKAICPVHGPAIRSHNAWCPYRIDPINHPYKIQCMEGDEWYSSNDYASGDMTSGEFPDDGEGVEIDGQHYYFLREYAHMAYGSVVIPALRSLSEAYAITGDAVYGRKGAILLARLASEYPNHEDRQDRLYFAKYGGRSPQYKWKRGGMITDLIWETFCLEGAVYAYDGLFPYLDQDPGLLTYLQTKGLPVTSPDDLRAYIEHYLLKAGMKGLLSGAIRGNEGHHQAAALACALVLDDYAGASPNSTDLVDYAYHGPGHAAYLLINGLQRDGGGHESPGYNRIKADFIRVNRAMDEVRKRQPDSFPLDRYPDLFENLKARALFDWFIDLTVLDRTMPSIGDSGGIGPPSRMSGISHSYLGVANAYAFERYGDPRYARACIGPDGEMLPGDLFESFPGDRIQATLESPESRIERKPRLLDGYGVALLESGEEPNRRAVTLNYSGILGHRQQDNLVLELFARGLEMLPDLGYPALWEYVQRWDANSMAHNTVTVDETQPVRGIGGVCRLFGSAGGVHVVSASHDPYPSETTTLGSPDSRMTDLYERTVVLVDVDPDRFYVVDLFAVNGGQQHDQSWHGMLRPVDSPQLNWQGQASGTLAGQDVEQFASWTDRWGRERDDFPAFLTQIRSTDLNEPAVWSWDSGLPDGDAVRLHLVPVGGPMRVIEGSGRSPAWAEDRRLDYIIARKEAPEETPSYYLSVIDASQGEPVVTGVRLLAEQPMVLEVLRPDGIDLIHLNVPGGPSRTTVHRPLGIRVLSRSGDDLTRDARFGHWGPESEEGYMRGTIVAVDYETNRVAVDASAPGAKSLAPRQSVRIFNAGRSAMYRIGSVNKDNGHVWLTLDSTALVARGPVTRASERRVTLGAHLTFANGRTDEKGVLLPGRDYFAGSRLGDESGTLEVRGAVNLSGGSESLLYLEDGEALSCITEGQVVSVWQFGVGDSLEVARAEG